MAADVKAQLPPKPLHKSKTAWGAVAMLLSLALQHYQIEASPDEVDTFTGQLMQLSDLISGVVGFILVLWGRISAKQPIKLPG